MNHWKSELPEYASWEMMKNRCLNPNADKYSFYGRRGIKICKRWMRFENFYNDMGKRPKGMSLDRKDTYGNYEPGNCRWATQTEQCNNTRANRILKIGSKNVTLAEASRIWKIPVSTIWSRLNAGWGEEDAVKRSVRKHKSLCL